jgi:hypothetical protein
MDKDLQKLIKEVLDDFFIKNKSRLDPYPEIKGPPPSDKKEER